MKYNPVSIDNNSVLCKCKKCGALYNTINEAEDCYDSHIEIEINKNTLIICPTCKVAYKAKYMKLSYIEQIDDFYIECDSCYNTREDKMKCDSCNGTGQCKECGGIGYKDGI